MSFDAFTDVIAALKTAWQTDAALLEFCVENYGVQPAIFIGLDENNPPAKEFYPLIAAMEFRSRGGGSAARNIFDVTIGCGVEDPEKSEDAVTRTYTYHGAMRAEHLRALAFAALVNSNFGKITVQAETGQTSVYPLFVSGMTVEIETVNARRRTG